MKTDTLVIVFYIVFLFVSIYLLSGCASIGETISGKDAAYQYYRVDYPDGRKEVKVSVGSGRDVGEAGLKINEDGSLEASAASLESTQNELIQMLIQTIGSLK